jgi:hypothetical protein
MPGWRCCDRNGGWCHDWMTVMVVDDARDRWLKRFFAQIEKEVDRCTI